MAEFLRSILFSSIILLGGASAPSSSQSPAVAPSSVAEPLGSTLQTPPAPSSVAEPAGWIVHSPPAPSPGALVDGYAERETSAEFHEQDHEATGYLRRLDRKQKAGVVLMALGGSGLLVYGGRMLLEKVRRGSSRRRRFGFLVQPRK